MNRRLKNRLIDLAFNDLSQEESAKLEARAKKSPKTAAELRELRVLSEGLKDLNPPEHQLSNDRLRAAILGQGLKPKPAQEGWDWGFIGMCAGSFGVAAVAVLFLHSRHIGPGQIVGGTSVASLSLPTQEQAVIGATVAEAQVIFKPFSATETAATSVKPYFALADRHTTRRGHRKPLLKQQDDSVDDYSNMYVLNPPDGGNMHAAVMETSEAASGLKPVGGQTAGNVVVIDPERDEDTGARKAREVSGGTNVPVSG